MSKRGSKSSSFIGQTKSIKSHIGGYKIKKSFPMRATYKIKYLTKREVQGKAKTDLIKLIENLKKQYENIEFKNIEKTPSNDIFYLTSFDVQSAVNSKLVNFFLQTQAKIKALEYLDN